MVTAGSSWDLSVVEMWACIDGWLASEHPNLASRLAPPASGEQIAQLETLLGVELPADFRASLRIHAGGQLRTGRSGTYADSPFYEFRLLGPEVLLDCRARLAGYASVPLAPNASVGATVKRAYHEPGWIPIVAADEDRTAFYCIDTVPAVPAARFQIVEMITNAPERAAPWPSFRHLLADRLVEPIVRGMPIDEECLDECQMLRFTRT